MKTRYIMDQDLSASDDVPGPCVYCRISDEELSASNEVAICGGPPCRISDEELSASKEVMLCGGPPCRISDEDLSVSAARPVPCAVCVIDA